MILREGPCFPAAIISTYTHEARHVQAGRFLNGQPPEEFHSHFPSFSPGNTSTHQFPFHSVVWSKTETTRSVRSSHLHLIKSAPEDRWKWSIFHTAPLCQLRSVETTPPADYKFFLSEGSLSAQHHRDWQTLWRRVFSLFSLSSPFCPPASLLYAACFLHVSCPSQLSLDGMPGSQ